MAQQPPQQQPPIVDPALASWVFYNDIINQTQQALVAKNNAGVPLPIMNTILSGWADRLVSFPFQNVNENPKAIQHRADMFKRGRQITSQEAIVEFNKPKVINGAPVQDRRRALARHYGDLEESAPLVFLNDIEFTDYKDFEENCPDAEEFTIAPKRAANPLRDGDELHAMFDALAKGRVKRPNLGEIYAEELAKAEAAAEAEAAAANQTVKEEGQEQQRQQTKQDEDNEPYVPKNTRDGNELVSLTATRVTNGNQQGGAAGFINSTLAQANQSGGTTAGAAKTDDGQDWVDLNTLYKKYEIKYDFPADYDDPVEIARYTHQWVIENQSKPWDDEIPTHRDQLVGADVSKFISPQDFTDNIQQRLLFPRSISVCPGVSKAISHQLVSASQALYVKNNRREKIAKRKASHLEEEKLHSASGQTVATFPFALGSNNKTKQSTTTTTTTQTEQITTTRAAKLKAAAGISEIGNESDDDDDGEEEEIKSSRKSKKTKKAKNSRGRKGVQDDDEEDLEDDDDDVPVEQDEFILQQIYEASLQAEPKVSATRGKKSQTTQWAFEFRNVILRVGYDDLFYHTLRVYLRRK